MAITYTDINNGEDGSSVRAKINGFNNSVAIDINNNTTNTTTNTNNITTANSNIETNVSAIAALDVRVAANETGISDLENTGMTVMSGSDIAPQTIAITATKIISFDTTSVSVGVGSNWDATNSRMQATLSGVFKLRYESFVSYASNVTITWQIYKNGVVFGNAITLAGKGAEIFPIVLISSTNLLADDYLELHGTASAETALTVVQANGTLEKTHF